MRAADRLFGAGGEQILRVERQHEKAERLEGYRAHRKTELRRGKRVAYDWSRCVEDVAQPHGRCRRDASDHDREDHQDVLHDRDIGGRADASHRDVSEG
jgi:hypothetical protein